MVDLPIPKIETALAEAPQQRVSAAAYTASGMNIADGLSAIGKGLEDLSVPVAENQAREDAKKGTTRDENGNIQVATANNNFILGKAGHHYEAALTAGKFAQGQAETSRALNQMRIDHEGNPEAYKAASNAYLENLKAQNGNTPLGASMFANATQVATQHYNGLVNNKAVSDTATSKANILAQIESAKNDLAQLARQGGVETHEFEAKKDELDELHNSLGDNPLFQVPKDVLENQKKATEFYLQGQAIVGHIDRIYASPDGLKGAQKNLHESVASLEGADDHQRNQLIAQGEARLSYLQGQNASEIAANRANVEALASTPSGQVIHNDVYQAAIDKAVSLGDTESAQKIHAMRAVRSLAVATNNLSPSQSVAAQGANSGGNISQPAPGANGVGLKNAAYLKHVDQMGEAGNLSPSMHFNHLMSIGATRNEALMLTGAAASESSFNYNASHDKDKVTGLPTGTGLYGHNHGRLDMRGKSWQDQATAALAELRSRPEGKAVNEATTPEQLATAQMHYERPAGYTSNNPQGGDNYTGRLNTIRHFSSLGGGQSYPQVGGPPSANGVPFTPQQLKENPFLLSTWVKSAASDYTAQSTAAQTLGAAIQKSLSNGITPAPAVMANYVQLSEGKPAFTEQRNAIQAVVMGRAAADEAMGMSPGAGQAYMDSVKAAAQGSSIFHGQVAQQAQELYTKDRAALKSDPIGVAVAKGWAPKLPLPLNFNDPHALAVGITQRSDIMTAIGVREQDASQSAIPPAEIDQVKGVIANGTLAQKMSLVNAISMQPEAIQKETLKAIGATGDTGKVFAIAGNIASVAPPVAQEILSGKAALDLEPKLAPKGADFTREMGKAMPPSSFGPEARDYISKAVEAIYANKSKSANDLTGILNQKRFDESVQAVTGGLVSMRGNKVVSPWYGAKQEHLDAALRAVTDMDLAGSVTGGGVPLPANALKPGMSAFFTSNNWRLENEKIGSGTYRVYAGSDDAKQYLKDTNGKPFILNLAAKRKDVEAEQMRPGRYESSAQAFRNTYVDSPLNSRPGDRLSPTPGPDDY